MGKYHWTIDLLFDWFGLVCFANKNKYCQLSYSGFQTSQSGGLQYSDTSPFSIPCSTPWISYYNSPTLATKQQLNLSQMRPCCIFRQSFRRCRERRRCRRTFRPQSFFQSIRGWPPFRRSCIRSRGRRHLRRRPWRRNSWRRSVRRRRRGWRRARKWRRTKWRCLKVW